MQSARTFRGLDIHVCSREGSVAFADVLDGGDAVVLVTREETPTRDFASLFLVFFFCLSVPGDAIHSHLLSSGPSIEAQPRSTLLPASIVVDMATMRTTRMHGSMSTATWRCKHSTKPTWWMGRRTSHTSKPCRHLTRADVEPRELYTTLGDDPESMEVRTRSQQHARRMKQHEHHVQREPWFGSTTSHSQQRRRLNNNTMQLGGDA